MKIRAIEYLTQSHLVTLKLWKYPRFFTKISGLFHNISSKQTCWQLLNFMRIFAIFLKIFGKHCESFYHISHTKFCLNLHKFCVVPATLKIQSMASTPAWMRWGGWDRRRPPPAGSGTRSSPGRWASGGTRTRRPSPSPSAGGRRPPWWPARSLPSPSPSQAVINRGGDQSRPSSP